MKFDPIEMEVVTDGSFNIGDEIALAYKADHPWSPNELATSWLMVMAFEESEMILKGFGQIGKIRGPNSVFIFVRKIKFQEYALDQELDNAEELL